MTTLALLLVCAPLVVAMYAYVVYPLVLLVFASKGPRAPAADAGTPLVTIVIPAYNEEAQIRGAIEALIAQDYPDAKRQILILSDGSTDGTDAIVKEYAGHGVELLRLPVRAGKTAAENASIPRIRGDLVINTDASIRLHPLAVRLLVAEFADPSVGVASSRDVSVGGGSSHTNRTEAGYVGYEMWIRSLETRAGGIVGASGSGYAIRADLHRIPVRHDLSRDFSAALTARRHGYRAVSVNDAICYVPRTTSLRAEYRRKVRTMSRGMATLIHNRALLDVTQGLFAWKLLSHKVCRWLLPVTIIPSLVGIAVLARDHAIAGLLLGAAFLGAAVAGMGVWWSTRRPLPRALSLVTFAAAANVAVIHAAWRVLNEHDDHLWEPTRREE